ncbi:MAG: hypothetical protein VSS75_006500, partial [Candidatus Parabeggiatoa sp.]|nr:hypothetical protein [Candidatus Parabeggiatoa sp.]
MGHSSNASGKLNWSDHCGRKSFQIPIFDDSKVDSDETRHLELYNPYGTTLNHSDAILTIIDD